MLENLKKRWKVDTLSMVLIICTFALGGSLCGYLGRKLLVWSGLEKGTVWVIVYIILISLLWPLCVLLISIPLGQFRFFRSYLVKIGKRFWGKRAPSTINVAIFASGAGSNALKIIEKFHNNASIRINLIVCNKDGAGVLEIARKAQIPALFIEKERFFRGDAYLPALKEQGIDFIVLAGFLWKVPASLVQAYAGKIVNIHPALLPKYGGKGMYGDRVHEAVIAAGEKESGITIHWVDEQYDHGSTIFQAKCAVDPLETPQTLAKKIHELEHLHFPEIVEGCILKMQNRS